MTQADSGDALTDIVRASAYTRFRDWVERHTGETVTIAWNEWQMSMGRPRPEKVLQLGGVDQLPVEELVAVTLESGETRRCSLPEGPNLDYDDPSGPDSHGGLPCPVHDEFSWRLPGSRRPMLRPRTDGGHMNLTVLPKRLNGALCFCGRTAVVHLEAYDADDLWAWSGPRCREHTGGARIVTERQIGDWICECGQKAMMLVRWFDSVDTLLGLMRLCDQHAADPGPARFLPAGMTFHGVSEPERRRRVQSELDRLLAGEFDVVTLWDTYRREYSVQIEYLLASRTLTIDVPMRAATAPLQLEPLVIARLHLLGFRSETAAGSVMTLQSPDAAQIVDLCESVFRLLGSSSTFVPAISTRTWRTGDRHVPRMVPRFDVRELADIDAWLARVPATGTGTDPTGSESLIYRKSIGDAEALCLQYISHFGTNHAIDWNDELLQAARSRWWKGPAQMTIPIPETPVTIALAERLGLAREVAERDWRCSWADSRSEFESYMSHMIKALDAWLELLHPAWDAEQVACPRCQSAQVTDQRALPPVPDRRCLHCRFQWSRFQVPASE